MFSLHATKVYNSIEGGLLTYNNKEFTKEFTSKFNMYKNFGIIGQDNIEVIGLNAKMNEFQAAMGLVNLKYIDEQIRKRKRVAEAYREKLKEIKGITYLNDKKNVKHNYAYFPIIVDKAITGIDRDELHERLKEYNIFTRKYFYPLTSNFQCYNGKYENEKLDNARYISERVLTLPMYGELDIEDANKIANAIKEIIG